MESDIENLWIDRKLFEDKIYNLLNIAENYILQNTKWKSEIIGTQREEIPEIPVAVIRAVLTNCFAHTVYCPGAYASNYKPEGYIKGNKESAIWNVIISKILYVTLNGTEMSVLAILRQKPDSSRNEIADKISKTVRTVQRALDSLREKGDIQRIGSKWNARWEVLK